MNTPDQNPKPQGWAEFEWQAKAQLAQAVSRIAELESENAELKASNEMAAEHMACGREYSARLEAELDALKNKRKCKKH